MDSHGTWFSLMTPDNKECSKGEGCRSSAAMEPWPSGYVHSVFSLSSSNSGDHIVMFLEESASGWGRVGVEGGRVGWAFLLHCSAESTGHLFYPRLIQLQYKILYINWLNIAGFKYRLVPLFYWLLCVHVQL